MDWTLDLPTWSNPALSRRIACGPHRWHVQQTGEGQDVMLLPGAGASVHTWRDLIPRLAESHRVLTLDLPGQGFTQSPNAARCGLEEMTADIETLSRSEGWEPDVLIGHSAGAAIALRLAPRLGASKVIGINPALDNFEGLAGWLFPILARLLAASPLTASFFAFGATEARARRLIEGTGSKIDAEGLAFYTRLTGDRAHVNGTLQMMARWSLDGLVADLPKSEADVLFLTGANDTAVPPRVAEKAAAMMPQAEVRMIEGLGHLAHEEDPERILAEISAFLQR